MTSDVSINGWQVIDNQTDPRLKRFTIPDTGRKVLLRADAAPILLRIGTSFHRHIANLDTDPLAVWGYNKRRIRIDQNNPDAPWSDHASGTAIDLRSDKFPIGKRNMTTRQRFWVRRILKNCEGLVIWGGDYKTNPDEMHFAIAPGVTAKQVKSWALRHGINSDGTKA